MSEVIENLGISKGLLRVPRRMILLSFSILKPPCQKHARASNYGE